MADTNNSLHRILTFDQNKRAAITPDKQYHDADSDKSQSLWNSLLGGKGGQPAKAEQVPEQAPAEPKSPVVDPEMYKQRMRGMKF